MTVHGIVQRRASPLAAFALVLVVLLTSACSAFTGVTAPPATPLPSSTPVPTGVADPQPTAPPTSTPTPLPTVMPSPTLGPRSAFPSLPLDPTAHAEVMVPGAVGDLGTLGKAPRYQIVATFDPDKMVLLGTERVQIANRWGESLDRVYFRLYPNAKSLYGPAKMTLHGVLDESNLPLDWAEEGDSTIIRVNLSQPVVPGNSFMLTLMWDAAIPEDIGHAWTRADGYGLFRKARGLVVLANWFPMLAIYDGTRWHLDKVANWGDPVYSEVAFFEVKLAAPQSYTVITTGSEVSSESGANLITHQFLSGPTRDFMLVLGENLQWETRVVGDTLVRDYFFPEDRSPGEEALSVTVDALQTFDRRYAVYPYRELDLVETPLLNLLGMEYPGMVLLSDNMYIGDQKWRLDITASHEISHQWWYGVVGNDILNEPWLDEGMATFSSGVYVGDVWGAASFRQQYAEWMGHYTSAGSGEITWPVARFATGTQYGGTVYYKAAVFLDALRTEVGEDAFYRALRLYYQTFKYRQATTSDFLSAFETVSSRDLSAFYAQWLQVP